MQNLSLSFENLLMEFMLLQFSRRRASLWLLPIQGDWKWHALGGRRQGLYFSDLVLSQETNIISICSIPSKRVMLFLFFFGSIVGCSRCCRCRHRCKPISRGGRRWGRWRSGCQGRRHRWHLPAAGLFSFLGLSFFFIVTICTLKIARKW